MDPKAQAKALQAIARSVRRQADEITKSLISKSADDADLTHHFREQPTDEMHDVMFQDHLKNRSFSHIGEHPHSYSGVWNGPQEQSEMQRKAYQRGGMEALDEARKAGMQGDYKHESFGWEHEHLPDETIHNDHAAMVAHVGAKADVERQHAPWNNYWQGLHARFAATTHPEEKRKDVTQFLNERTHQHMGDWMGKMDDGLADRAYEREREGDPHAEARAAYHQGVMAPAIAAANASRGAYFSGARP